MKKSTPAHARATTKPDLVAIANRFRVLSVPTRLAILHTLHDGERTVADLAVVVRTSQPNVSKHLRVLVDAGIVARREEGATTWCRIADTLVFRLCDLVCEGRGPMTVGSNPHNRSATGKKHPRTDALPFHAAGRKR